MYKKLYRILNSKKEVKSIAKEITETFIEEASDENIDYSFTINRETGSISANSANTYFVFDTKEGTHLDKFKKSLFSEELKSIEEGSKEEINLMDDVGKFLGKICKDISENRTEKIRKVVREVILGGKVDKSIASLDQIEVLSVDVADYSSIPDPAKYLLKIGKIPGSDCPTDEIVQYIQNKQEESDLSLDEILKIEKTSGNVMFENVIAVEQGRKFLNEICLFMFVDYSLASTEKIIVDKDVE